MDRPQRYEAREGPSFEQIYALIKQPSRQPAKHLGRCLEWLCFNLLIGNNDSHAKNISLLYEGKNPASMQWTGPWGFERGLSPRPSLAWRARLESQMLLMASEMKVLYPKSTVGKWISEVFWSRILHFTKFSDILQKA